MKKIVLSAIISLVFASSGCVNVPILQQAPAAVSATQESLAASSPVSTDPAIITSLVDVVKEKGSYKLDLAQAEGTPLGDILKLGSPVGYSLRNRYLNIGVPMAEAFSRNSDPAFRAQLVELARWDKNAETRSAALIALARNHELRDLGIFNEALIHLDPAVRFGALEALIVWENPKQAMPLLAAASEKDYEPILRVYAAAGLARLGDPPGIIRLRYFLDNPSWIVRSMAARYLGEYGTAEDYDLLVTRIGRELTNDFVVAEYCIAALKLFPKKDAAVNR